MIPVFILMLAGQMSSSTATATATATATTPPAAATPSAPAPVPTATPVSAGDPYRPRPLSELAKDRHLGRLTGTGAAVVTTPEPELAPQGTPPASSGSSASAAARRSGMLHVEDVQDNGAVTDGRVSVYGAVRNTGRVPLCRVRIFLRLFDDHGVLLSTGETTTDLKIVAVGEAVTFGGIVKAPAGLRGSSERKLDPLIDGRSATNWQRVGRIQAEIIDASDECS